MKRLFKLFSLLSCIAVFTFCIIGVKNESIKIKKELNENE